MIKTNLFLALCVVFFSCSRQPQFDTIIRHGMVYDGSGGEPYKADIGINADTISKIGDLSKALSGNEVEASGLFVTPGFIDTHSHHDGELFIHRDVLAAVSQGITTIITGQDGFSSYPLSKFYKQLGDTPVAVNIGSYCGHNTLRNSVLGKNFTRHATTVEIDSMKAMLVQDLESGALGFSTGLEYDPGLYSAREEVLALAMALGPFKGRYISHIRSEDRYFWKAINEIIQIGKETGVPVQVSHIKMAMQNVWGKADSLISILDLARKNGVNITSDIYPYTFWHSTIKVLFPDHNFTDEREAELILREITLPEDIIISTLEVQPEYEGKSLAAIARLENKTPARMLVDLIKRINAWEKRNDRACNDNIMATSMDDPDIKKLMKWQHANICSDGSSSGGHPRGYGAFTRVLGHYVREERALSWQEAIHKMTELSAEHAGIKKRGLIKQGFFADLVLFNSETVQDKATISEPQKISEGIERVWVNGSLVYENQKTTGKYPGKIIRRQN